MKQISFKNQLKAKLYKVYSYRHWEFLPASIFYTPIVFYYIFLMIKYRISATAISAVNPCFAAGGMAFDSKYDMISKFFKFPEYVANTIYVSEKDLENPELILQEIRKNHLEYPFICKPDKGHRGNGVKIIRNLDDLIHYINLCNRPFLVQEYIDYPLEYGVFWTRNSGERIGKVTSITRKILPSLKGDGKSTLAELIFKDSRAKFMANAYFEKNKNSINQIVPLNEMKRICNTGNHCQGAIFEEGEGDIKGLTLKKLEEICASVKGYEFGRMDIKFKDQESLLSGKYFKILEVNGSEAESTHIYDRKYSLFYAYKTLFKQWDSLFKIARYNRDNGFKGLNARKLIKSYLAFFSENKEIKSD